MVDDLQMIALRNALCGMHVHVELPEPDARVSVMTRMLPFLPLFIALATSSPFWHSRPTGLMGYRLAAYDEEPRTGMPELFHDKKEFDAYVAALVKAGVIADASFIWWAMRPSLALPTLELRAPDSCTVIEDSLAIAALFRVLARRLFRDPRLNADLGPVGRAIAVENKWRAQRYGVHGTFVGEDGAVTVRGDDRAGHRGDRGRRGGARLHRRARALPHHRRRRHLGRRPACALRGARPHARPRRGARGGEPLARGDHAG